jgi:hypothetical protein
MGGRRKPTVSQGKRRVTGIDRSCESETYLFLNFYNFFGVLQGEREPSVCHNVLRQIDKPKKPYFYKLS